MARPWVKLHTKMLDNPDMAELPDYLYRRWIELLMLAGRNDADGQLQPVKKMAFILHLPEVKLSEALTALSAVGVVHQETDGSWHITNWRKHQYSESVDRVRKYREKHKEIDENSARYSNESERKNANSARVTSLSSTSTLISSDSSILFKLYESEIGTITKSMADVLGDAWDEYPHEWFPVAIAEAVRNNARKWAYIEAILKRWKVDGFQSKNGKGAPASKVKNAGVIEAARRKLERGESLG